MKKILLFTILVTPFVLQNVQATDLLSSWQAARSYDANFAMARDALAVGAENAKQGDAAILPQVTMTGDASQSTSTYHAGQYGISDPSATKQGQTYNTALNLTQPIYDASAFATRKQLKKKTVQAQILYQAAEQDLILRVAKAYFDVLIAQENLALVNSQKEAVSQQLALARKTFAVGRSTITDTNEAQARYDAIIASEISAKNDLVVKANAYRNLTNQPPTRLNVFADLRMPTAPEPSSVDIWMGKAREDSLTIRAQQIDLDIASFDIERYRLENSPKLSLVASYGNQTENGSISTSGGRDRTLSGFIGLQLTIPLYTGGQRSSQLRQAISFRDQQRDTLEQIRRDTEQSARQYYLGVESGAAQIKALEQAKTSSASSVASSKMGREVGVRTTVDVLNAEQNYYQTVYNLVLAKYQYLFNKLQLSASVGNLNEAELVDVNSWLAAQTQIQEKH
ncbi:outer membrane protein [Collimonas sp. OK307]|uniref:TolC family outer membrane protein n=1 Tax=Collimonas sp. OK307 TaxID=1801620 RepID=UPI0008E8587E|nr:TolC family outer membrane protein [Collimonas sp. OK307]SFH68168.1 outer membrane protein [Collimonas sp. OK307]